MNPRTLQRLRDFAGRFPTTATTKSVGERKEIADAITELLNDYERRAANER